MKAYPAYKDSGIEWVGKIPEHWSSKKLKYVCNTLPSNIDKKSKEGESIIFLCNYMDVYRNEFITDDITFMKATASDIQIEKFLLKNGDVLVTKDSEDPKDIAVPAIVTKNYENVVCGYHLTRIRPKNEILGRYLFRLLQAKPFNSYFEVNAKGVTRFGLGTEAFLNFEILVPTIQEQTAIANFLDHKTAQIDLAIEKGQQLIELLQEQRAAIINEAVTKGINPDVHMKDSGIEWIGEVPAHWEVKKLKYIIEGFESGVSVNSEDIPVKNDEIGVLKTSCVFKDFFDPAENKRVLKEEIERVKTPVRKGAIIISRINTPQLVGASGLVKESYDNLFLPDRLWQTIFVPDVKINAQWLSFLLVSNSFRKEVQSFATGTSSSMKNITKENYLNISIPFPELNEQNIIVNNIIKIVTQINKEIQSTQKEIELLKEYRQSLIAEAVTGKIDIRDYPLN